MRILAIDPGPAEVTFFVPGIPKPGGSKRGFVNPKTGRVMVTEDCLRSKDWRAVVALKAAEVMGERDPMAGPLSARFVFLFLRPKGHYGKRGLRASAPAYPTGRPDTTKLLRSTEDALKAIAWRDDSQIVLQVATKQYAAEGKAPGAQITIGPAGAPLVRAVTYSDQLAEEQAFQGSE